MKNNNNNIPRLPKAALAAAALLAAFTGLTPTALGQTTLDWTGSTSATGPANASGDWDQSTNNWWNDTSSTNAAWTNGDTARFNNNIGSGTYTVTLTENIIAAALSLHSGTMTYQFNGTDVSLTLGSLSTQNSKSTVFNVPVILSGNQSWNMQGTAPVTANQPISGAFTLTKTGAGTLTLNAANTFSALTFSQGKIVIGNDDALGTATVGISGSPTWESTAARTFSNSISTSLTSTGIVFSGTHAMTFAGDYSFSTGTGGGGERNLTFNVGTTDGVTFSGNIFKADTNNTGLLNIIKTGASTLTLSGDNAYNGATTVSAGTLLINGDQTASTGLTTVAADAILGGTGTIGGDLSFLQDSIFHIFDINNPLAVNGTVTFGTGFGIDNLSGIDWASLDLNTGYTLISTSQSFSSSDIANFGLANATDVGGGRSAYFDTGSLQVVVIPEPGTLVLVGMMGLALLVCLRRRK